MTTPTTARAASPGRGCCSTRPAGSHLDLDLSVSVGDRWRDVEAARRAGVHAVYVDRDYGERRAVDADAVVASLPDAVGVIEAFRDKGRTTT